MTTIAEIEAAIEVLPVLEQEQLHSHLTAKLFAHSASHSERLVEAGNRDPVLELIDELSRELPDDGPTNIAANYKEYLYGYGSAE